ncbi:MAG: S8 family serine peptidase [Bacteroidales bacterium]|nr:S8 family serine peptidase [Bacteroidales bacterium]
MIKSIILFFAFQLFLPGINIGQDYNFPEPREPVQSWWVYFTDKDSVIFDPYLFFDPKAIGRRLRHNQDLYDVADYPVSEHYLSGVSSWVDSVNVVSRWLNAVNVNAQLWQIDAIRQLPFVKSVEPEILQLLITAENPGKHQRPNSTEIKLERIQAHTAHFQGNYFTDHGIDGSNIRIAIFDTGFPRVDSHNAFQHINNDGRIKAIWDFVSKSPDVYRKNAHGTMVMSLIGGMYGSIPMGLAPGAEFILARTETWTEPYVEEKYWLAAAEWADQLGADIISSSLGYSYHRYFPEQMDGKSSLVAFAADMAVQKGIVVVNAAGNDGSRKSWEIIISPADTDGVLSIGALDYPSLLRSSYSSKGPSADGRLKPELSALGSVFVATTNGFGFRSGTSFACPLVSGFAACVMQLHPDWTNLQVLEAMQQSASLYPYYDYSHGYGTPQASWFFSDPADTVQPTFDFVADSGQVKILVRLSETEIFESILKKPYVFYHIRDAQGKIEEYHVAAIKKREVLSFDKTKFRTGQQMFVHIAGYTSSWKF